MMLDALNGVKIWSLHVAYIDHYKVAVNTRDGIIEVRVDMLSICMHRRGLMTKTFRSTNTSHNTVKIYVLKRALGLEKMEEHIDIRVTDDIPGVRVDMSST